MIKNILKLILVILFFNACFDEKKDNTIRIGVVLGLTGKYSDISLYEKNGIIFAFEQINYKLNNNKIELIFKDGKQIKRS